MTFGAQFRPMFILINMFDTIVSLVVQKLKYKKNHHRCYSNRLTLHVGGQLMRTAVVGSISLMNIVIYLNILNTKYTKYLNTPTGASTNLKNFNLNKDLGLCLYQNMLITSYCIQTNFVLDALLYLAFTKR